MHHNSLFSEFGKHNKKRVIDVVNKIASDMLLYDKKMSSALICMEYDEACVKGGPVSQALNKRMLFLIEETYHGFANSMNHNNPNVMKHLQSINQYIDDIKANNSVDLLKAYEAISIKLTALESINANSSFDKLLCDNNAILTTSLTNLDEALIKMKQLLAVFSEHDVSLLRKCIPIYSRNTTVGFNTALFCIFNGYSPIGVGESPHPVHAGILKNTYSSMLKHNYVHMYDILKLKTDDPATFDLYKNLYNTLFKNKEINIYDMEFKEDMLVLFLLVHDLAYSPNDPKSIDVKKFIINSTPSMKVLIEKNPHLQTLINKDHLTTAEEDMLNKGISLVSDYIKPLRELGYKITDHGSQLWKNTEELQNALLTIVTRFNSRHPEIALTSKPTLQNAPSL